MDRLSSVEPSASLFTGTQTSQLMLYLSNIVLSFITSVALLASDMNSFSYWIAQFCGCACQFSLNCSRHDIKPLHWKAVLWNFNNPVSSLNLWTLYFLALANNHQSELTEVSSLHIRILGPRTPVCDMFCFHLPVLCLQYSLPVNTTKRNSTYTL